MTARGEAVVPRSWKIALGGGLVLVVVLAAVVTGFSDDGTSAPKVGRMTRMEQSGELDEMLEQHRQMILRMQDDASPAMLELMNNDPLWQMMRSPEWARLDEEHQEDIDRMLSK
jgi:hypothetical protein